MVRFEDKMQDIIEALHKSGLLKNWCTSFVLKWCFRPKHIKLSMQ